MQKPKSPSPETQTSVGTELASANTDSAPQQAVSQASSSMPGISKPDKMDSIQSSAAEALDRAGCISPSSPISSRTPPPSTRAPARKPSPSPPSCSRNDISQRDRTPSLPAPVLSSPPPTVQQSLGRADRHSESSYTIPTADQIANASSTELRTFMEKAASEIVRLNDSLHESRTATAHYRLQNNLLSFEADEAANRMAVEYEMMRREIDVLQKLAVRRRENLSQQDEPAAPSHLTLKLKQQCQSLESENDLLRRRLGRAKKLIRKRDSLITSLRAESESLATRIRENRVNFDLLRRRGVIYNDSIPRQMPMTQGTAPRRGPGNGGEDTFAALLLADQVLSQEDPSAGSTPAYPRPSRPPHSGHIRGTQSLSSLPSTPWQFPSMAIKIADTTGCPRLRASERHSSKNQSSLAHDDRQRGESTDSTISAPEDEGPGPSDRRRSSTKKGSNDTVQESVACQLVTHMLRRPESYASTQTKQPSARNKKSSLTGRSPDEAGMTGRRTEAREHEDEMDRPSKRVKTGKGGPIGLGIERLGK